MNIFSFHVNSLQRVTSTEVDFHYQADRMIGSVYSSQSLSSVAPVLTNGLMNKVAMMAGMEVLHGLSDMDSHTPRMIWLQSLLRAQSSRSRNQP